MQKIALVAKNRIKRKITMDSKEFLKIIRAEIKRLKLKPQDNIFEVLLDLAQDEHESYSAEIAGLAKEMDYASASANMWCRRGLEEFIFHLFNQLLQDTKERACRCGKKINSKNRSACACSNCGTMNPPKRTPLKTK